MAEPQNPLNDPIDPDADAAADASLQNSLFEAVEGLRQWAERLHTAQFELLHDLNEIMPGSVQTVKALNISESLWRLGEALEKFQFGLIGAAEDL